MLIALFSVSLNAKARRWKKFRCFHSGKIKYLLKTFHSYKHTSEESAWVNTLRTRHHHLHLKQPGSGGRRAQTDRAIRRRCCWGKCECVCAVPLQAKLKWCYHYVHRKRCEIISLSVCLMIAIRESESLYPTNGTRSITANESYYPNHLHMSQTLSRYVQAMDGMEGVSATKFFEMPIWGILKKNSRQ